MRQDSALTFDAKDRELRAANFSLPQGILENSPKLKGF
jgi:hypothetical protein